jgi:glucose/arabinose dehydrogenase
MAKPILARVAAWGVALLAAGLLVGPATSPAVAAAVTHQAENGTLSEGSLVESEHAGFTGTGYVNTPNAAGAFVEWRFTPATGGNVSLRFRYANGAAATRPATVTLNGTTIGTPSFPTTNAWTNYDMQSITASLPAGENVVRATATTAGGLSNMDSLVVDDGQGGGGGPISDPIKENPIASGIGLVLSQFGAQFPDTRSLIRPTPTDSRISTRRARINFLGQFPGQNRFYVPDLNGRIYTLSLDGATRTTYLDMRATIGNNFFSGQGMGSGSGFIAFHPNFATNGKFYTTHTEAFGVVNNPDVPPDWRQSSEFLHSVITEWTATNPAAATFSGSRRTVLRIGFATRLHAIQQIDFNVHAQPGDPDFGLLYLAVGDGGIGTNNGNTDPQRMNIPHGKVLRIDPLGTNGRGGRYGIPASNPFVGRPGALGEIYSLGYRDPHRFSFDSVTGRMFLGHIGEHDIEAIDEVGAGTNFGWPAREGPFEYRKSDRCNLYPLPADDAGFTYPVAAYDHNPAPGASCTADVGRAVVGGFVYRGSALPLLQGKYIFGDLVDGRVFYTNLSDMNPGTGLAPLHQLQIFTGTTRTTMQGLAGSNRVDMRFGVDRAGELYVMAKANGRIWKVTGVRGTAP